MPTQAQMDTMTTTLSNLANAIEANATAIAGKHTDIQNNEATVEVIHADLLLEVLNARFELNNQLIYTNDAQRNAALIQAKANSTDYQTARTAQIELAEERRLLESDVEHKRKKFRVNELMMLYWANTP